MIEQLELMIVALVQMSTMNNQHPVSAAELFQAAAEVLTPEVDRQKRY